MSTTIGINVIETDGSAAPAIAGAPTSVAAVVLRSKRGPTGAAVRVSNFRQFADRFGGHDSRFLGAYALEGMFLNGGREAHVARVVGAGAVAARVTLVDRSGNATLRVGAGYRGTEEVGDWGNDLYVDVRDNPEFSTPLAAGRTGNQPARLQGNALATSAVDLTVAAGQPARKLRVTVDTGTNFDINFDAASVPVLAAATPADIAQAINRVAGSRVVASESGGGVRIVSRTKGATSKVEVPAGFDDPTRTRVGLDLAAASGAAAPAGAYDEVQVTSLSGFAVGDVARLDDGITSDWVEDHGARGAPAGRRRGSVRGALRAAVRGAAERVPHAGRRHAVHHRVRPGCVATGGWRSCTAACGDLGQAHDAFYGRALCAEPGERRVLGLAPRGAERPESGRVHWPRRAGAGRRSPARRLHSRDLRAGPPAGQ